MRAAPAAPSLPSPLPARAGTLLPSASILAGSVPRCPAGSTALDRAPLGYCLATLPETEAVLSFRFVVARGSRPPRGGSPSGCDHGTPQGSLLGGEAEKSGVCFQVTKTQMCGFSAGRFLLPPSLLFVPQGTADEIRNCWQLEVQTASQQ